MMADKRYTCFVYRIIKYPVTMVGSIILVYLFYERFATCKYCLSENLSKADAAYTYDFLVSFLILFYVIIYFMSEKILETRLRFVAVYGATIGLISSITSYIIWYSFVVSNAVNEGTWNNDNNDFSFITIFILSEAIFRGGWLFGIFVCFSLRIDQRVKKSMQKTCHNKVCVN